MRIATEHLIFRWADMLASSYFVASTSKLEVFKEDGCSEGKAIGHVS